MIEPIAHLSSRRIQHHPIIKLRLKSIGALWAKDCLVRPKLRDFYLTFCGKARMGLRPAGAAAKDTQASSTPPSFLDGSSQAATAASVVGSVRLGLSGLS